MPTVHDAGDEVEQMQSVVIVRLRCDDTATMSKYLLVILTLLVWPIGLAAKPLVVLVSIDGFKPNYLKRGNSPVLDGLVDGGASAKGLIPAFPSVTFPNHYSMVTGLSPDHHGIVNNVMFDPTVPGPPFSLASRDALANPAWWNEATPILVTLRRQNKRSSAMFWPGSETPIHGIQPDDWLPYTDAMTSIERVEKLVYWLDRSQDDRADFATLYFSEVDSTAIASVLAPLRSERQSDESMRRWGTSSRVWSVWAFVIPPP